MFPPTIEATGAVAVPRIVSWFAAMGALEAIATTALKLPATVGVKVYAKVQDAPAASAPVQVFAEAKANTFEVSCTEDIAKGPLPQF